MATSQSNINIISEEVAHSLGYRRLKEEQIIDFVSGTDVFAILPTGYGTILCFVYLSSFHSAGN